MEVVLVVFAVLIIWAAIGFATATVAVKYNLQDADNVDDFVAILSLWPAVWLMELWDLIAKPFEGRGQWVQNYIDWIKS